MSVTTLIRNNAPKLWTPPDAEWTPARLGMAEAALALMQRIAEQHPSAAIATSLQAEDGVLVDMVARAHLSLDVVTLETGRLPVETFAAIRAIETRYGIKIEVFEPESASVREWVSDHGENALYDSAELRKSCCGLRKVAPLGRALQGRSAWVTGQRREQTLSRAELPEREFDAGNGVEKFNPLAEWSAADVWAYVRQHDVPIHPLYARGYASIGCDPCTRAIRADEDPRAGRWWWEESVIKECGLHVGEGI